MVDRKRRRSGAGSDVMSWRRSMIFEEALKLNWRKILWR
jgi:hypothetical protein